MRRTLHEILLNTFAAYGILWALALNLGLELPDRLRAFMKHILVQGVLLYTAAFLGTKSTLSSILAVGAHYSLVSFFKAENNESTHNFEPPLEHTPFMNSNIIRGKYVKYK